MIEEWRDVKGYEGLYQVSNFGEVKSILFKNNKCRFEREKIIKICTRKGTGNHKDRTIVMLHDEGKRQNFGVHRLVAIAFLPNENNLPEVNHLDGNPLNNRIDNLEWCTRAENCKHAYDNGLMPVFSSNNKLREKRVSRDDGKTYANIAEAASDNKRSKSAIKNALHGRSSSSNGYKFEFIN